MYMFTPECKKVFAVCVKLKFNWVSFLGIGCGECWFLNVATLTLRTLKGLDEFRTVFPIVFSIVDQSTGRYLSDFIRLNAVCSGQSKTC